METQLQNEIRTELCKYLDGAILLHEFENWFVPILWNIEEYNDSEAQALVGRIHSLIAECSAGDRSLESLRKELENFVHPVIAENSSGVSSSFPVSRYNPVAFNVAA